VVQQWLLMVCWTRNMKSKLFVERSVAKRLVTEARIWCIVGHSFQPKRWQWINFLFWLAVDKVFNATTGQTVCNWTDPCYGIRVTNDKGTCEIMVTQCLEPPFAQVSDLSHNSP
jgi:hypothetical protein